MGGCVREGVRGGGGRTCTCPCACARACVRVCARACVIAACCACPPKHPPKPPPPPTPTHTPHPLPRRSSGGYWDPGDVNRHRMLSEASRLVLHAYNSTVVEMSGLRAALAAGADALIEKESLMGGWVGGGVWVGEWGW